MKKFFLLVAFFFGLDAMAAKNCNLITGQKLSDVRSKNEIFYAGGGGYICDKNIGDDRCPYLAVIVQGNQAVYCKNQNGVTDTWVNYESDIRECSESDFDMLESGDLRRFGDFLVGKKFIEENGVAICKSKTCWSASAATGVNYKDFWLCKIAGEIPEKVVKPGCSPGSSDEIDDEKDCKGNETFVCTKDIKGECVCGRCLPKTVQEKKCLDSRTTKEGKACCYLPKSVATWDGKECTCIPADKMEFEIRSDGKGSCRAKELKTGEKFQCDTNILAQLEVWENECKDQEQIVEWIKRLKELCKSDEVIVQKYNEYFPMLLALEPGNCKWDNEIKVDVDVKLPGGNDGDRDAELSNSRRKISDAHTVLRGMAGTFKVSEWKDEEGKFNTARLTSDSIAAVVLGTTGALVTSNIVKKNQVENGFEDIKCTIGGQTVADWGDEFRVGIQ